MEREHKSDRVLVLGEEDFPVYASFRDKLRIIVPVCLLISFQQGLSQMGVILDNLQSFFPDASQTMIQMVIAAPSVTAIPVSLCSGILATLFPKKRIGLFALCCMLIGGVFPVFFHSSIWDLFFSSGLIGIAQGLIITTSTGIFAENFYGKDRDFAMGLKQVTDSIGNTIIALAAGFLCQIAWQWAYAVYFLVIPIIFLVWRYLPNGKPDDKIYSSGSGFGGLRFLIKPHYIFMCIMMAFCGIAVFGFYLNGSMVVVEKGLGDASLVGIIFSIQNVTTLIFGLLYMPIASVFKKYSLGCSFIVMVIAYVLFYIGDSVPMYIFAGALWGIGNSLIQSASLVFLANACPKGCYGLGLAIGNSMINVGISFAPLLINSLRGAIFNNTSPSCALLVVAFICLAAACVEFLREVFFVKVDHAEPAGKQS